MSRVDGRTCTFWYLWWQLRQPSYITEYCQISKAPMCKQSTCDALSQALKGSMRACREFYEHLRDWIVETELDRYRSGRIFEYMWAIMFGEPSLSEPLEECDLLYCNDEVRHASSSSKHLPLGNFAGFPTRSN